MSSVANGHLKHRLPLWMAPQQRGFVRGRDTVASVLHLETAARHRAPRDATTCRSLLGMHRPTDAATTTASTMRSSPDDDDDAAATKHDGQEVGHTARLSHAAGSARNAAHTTSRHACELRPATPHLLTPPTGTCCSLSSSVAKRTRSTRVTSREGVEVAVAEAPRRQGPHHTSTGDDRPASAQNADHHDDAGPD